MPESPPPPPPPPPAEDDAAPPPPPPPPPASGYESGFYIEGFGGYTFAGDLEVSGFEAETESGYNFGGAAGMHVTPNLDVELDVFFTELGYDVPFLTPVDLNALSFMIDGIYNFNAGGFVNPYLGAGLGMVGVGWDIPSDSERDWKFGYQLMGGVMLDVSEAFGIFAEYRFHDAVGDAEFFGVEVEYQTHNISAGIRFSF